MPISVHFVLYHPVVHRGTYAQALFKHRLAHAMVIYEILSAGSSTLRGQASRDSDFIRCHRLDLDVIGQEHIFCSKRWQFSPIMFVEAAPFSLADVVTLEPTKIKFVKIL